MERERNDLFDNIKAVMLFLVALGHILDVFINGGKNAVEYNTMKYIYLFHMPVFAFVSGYFSKNVNRSRENAVKKVLIPYLFFQILYVIVAAMMIHWKLVSFNSDVFNYSVILPSSAFYYLLALFIWKLLAVDILKLRFPIAISFLLGILISLTKYSDFHCGYGAVFSLLLFFVLGLKCDERIIERIRSIPKVIGIVILLLGIIPAVYFPYAIHSIRLNYADEGFSNLEGMAWRVVFYTVAILMGAAIINVMTDKRCFLSKIGKKSILVYAGSTFLAPSGYVLLNKLFRLDASRVVNFVGMILFCGFICFICSREFVSKLYEWIEGKIVFILFQKE